MWIRFSKFIKRYFITAGEAMDYVDRGKSNPTHLVFLRALQAITMITLFVLLALGAVAGLVFASATLAVIVFEIGGFVPGMITIVVLFFLVIAGLLTMIIKLGNG